MEEGKNAGAGYRNPAPPARSHHLHPTPSTSRNTKSSMEDDTSRLASKVQELGDIELAALLCFIAQEHCIIEADEEELQNVEQELGLVRINFGLS